MRLSHVTVKLAKLALISWILYITFTSRIRAHNASVLKNNLSFLLSSSSSTSISLVIAHPDDEVMFFAPTLLQLDSFLPSSVLFNVICLSKGNADNLGDKREVELQESINFLMANSNRDVQLYQFDYADGMEEIWDVDSLASTVLNDVLLPQGKKENVLLTFDAHGVSGHPNHISCHNAAEALLNDGHHHSKVSAAMYLNSHYRNFVLRYSAFAWDLLKLCFTAIFVKTDVNSVASNNVSLISTYPQYILSLASMGNAHQSQLVWFRYGWWFFSRFVFVNDLEIVFR